jgi:hypothetical protein
VVIYFSCNCDSDQTLSVDAKKDFVQFTMAGVGTGHQSYNLMEFREN